MSDESKNPLLPVQSTDIKNPADESNDRKPSNDSSDSKKNAGMEETSAPQSKLKDIDWPYVFICIINIILSALLLWAYVPFFLSTKCAWITGKVAILESISIFILLVAGLMGLVFWAFYWRDRRWLLLVLQVAAMVVLFYLCCVAFSLIVKGSGEKLPDKEYKEYRFEAYPGWVQGWVTNNWSKMKTCLKENGVCQGLEADGATVTEEDFYMEELSPIESGCCKPSNDCNFGYASPTKWVATANSSYTNSDCKRWSNNEDVLCFNCRSCKAGTLDNLRRNWGEFFMSLIFGSGSNKKTC